MSLQYKFLNDLNGIDLEPQYNDFLCAIRHIAESCGSIWQCFQEVHSQTIKGNNKHFYSKSFTTENKSWLDSINFFSPPNSSAFKRLEKRIGFCSARKAKDFEAAGGRFVFKGCFEVKTAYETEGSNPLD